MYIFISGSFYHYRFARFLHLTRFEAPFSHSHNIEQKKSVLAINSTNTLPSYQDIWSEKVKKYFKFFDLGKYKQEGRFWLRNDNMNAEADMYNARILDQMYYVPKTYSANSSTKYIFMPHEDHPEGYEKFKKDQCLVDKCYIINQYSTLASIPYVHAVMFKGGFQQDTEKKLLHQSVVWIYHQLESPLHSSSIDDITRPVNWTATYQFDSDLVTPYEYFVPFPNITNLRPLKKYSVSKKKLVAWVVSNCQTQNNRYQYAEKLQQFIQVDIYGYCSENLCDETDDVGIDRSECFRKLAKQYKFYLSFENSNCKYYITEKMFRNALR